MMTWFLLFLTSCSLFFAGKEGPKSAKGDRYTISFTAPSWQRQIDNRSDFIFQNKDGRTIISNSFCDEFQEQPLQQLAERSFRNIDRFQKKNGLLTDFKHRKAYRLDGEGEVDGIKVALKLLNTRRDNCYYDFLSIAPEGTKEDGSFERLLEGVIFR